MLFNKFSKKIFVSIASLADLELYPTVLDMIQKADKPENLFISVFSQDDDHPALEQIFEYYNIKNSYRKTTTKSARGLGFARFMTREGVERDDCKYYLQIDSHMRFDPGWDTALILWYERMHKIWGKSIISTYPHSYEYNEDGTIDYQKGPVPPCVELVFEKSYLRFQPKYTQYLGGDDGQETGYFCGGFSFGYKSYFDEVRPDPLIYFNGEEHLMAVRFYQKDIRIICPPEVPIYHDYVGVNRKRLWEVNPEKASLEQMSRRRVIEFYNGLIDDEFGVIDNMRFAYYFIKFVKNFPTEYAYIDEDDPFYDQWRQTYS